MLRCPKEELGSLICLLLAGHSLGPFWCHFLPHTSEPPQMGCELSEEWSFHCWPGAGYQCEKVSGDFCSKNLCVLLRQQLKGQFHLGRNISVVRDVFCVLCAGEPQGEQCCAKVAQAETGKKYSQFPFCSKNYGERGICHGGRRDSTSFLPLPNFICLYFPGITQAVTGV